MTAPATAEPAPQAVGGAAMPAGRPTLFTSPQRALLDHLQKGSPMPVERLIDVLYGACPDGGPDHANACLYNQICDLRRRLAPHGIALLTIGRGRSSQGYMIDPEHVRGLEALLVEALQFDLAFARGAK